MCIVRAYSPSYDKSDWSHKRVKPTDQPSTKDDGIGGRRLRSTVSPSRITDMAYDHSRSVALVSCLNRTIRVFDLSRHTIQGNLSLQDIRKRIVGAEEMRAQSKVHRLSAGDHTAQ